MRSEPRTFGIKEEKHRLGDVVRGVAPNWFAAVMGTGIVAIAAATLPLRVPGLRAFALAVWVLAAALLVVFTGALAAQWIWHRERALAHAANPVMAQYWGAPAMALMTVGGGTLLVGRDWLGLSAAVHTDWALWGLGTALGLVTACWIPYLMMTRHEIAADGAFGGWLMPVVPPMVSAANGALLVPYAAAGQARLTLLAGCYAMFGISLFASMIIIPLVWSRLVTYKTLPAVMVPTCWIVLGPLGQSITAAGNLARVAGLGLRAPYPAGAERVRPAVRAADVGVRDAVAGDRRGADGAGGARRDAVRADLVELHVPGRDRRDRDDLARRPHRTPRCCAGRASCCSRCWPWRGSWCWRGRLPEVSAGTLDYPPELSYGAAMASTVTPPPPEVARLFESRSEPARDLARQAGAVADACHAMAVRFHRGGKLIVFGTGGPSADAQHVAVEFVHPVIVGKRALPAISLTTDVATVTGIAEREGVAAIFAHQLRAVARPADIAMGISADGGSPSVLAGLETAHELGLLTIALAGGSGGRVAASPAVDHLLVVASSDPRVVKELQVTTYHVLWELVHVFFEQPGVLDPEVMR